MAAETPKRATPAFDLRRNARAILGVLLAVLVANTFFYLFVVAQRVKDTASLESERDSFQADLKAAQGRRDDLKKKRDQIRSNEEGLRSFYEEILGTRQTKMVEVEREIAEIGKDFGIAPQEMRFSNEEQPQGRVERFVMHLPLVGDYADLRRFIEKVEQSKNFLVIDRIGLSGTKEGGAMLQLTVDVATYFDAPWLATGRKLPRTGTGIRRGGA